MLDFTKEDLLKSPLNYTGGKFRLLPQILPLFPKEIETFIDLFAGGCDVAINVKAKNVVCNDKQKPLVDLYSLFKEKSADEVFGYIERTICEFNLSKTNKEAYLAIRKQYNETKYPLDLYICICHAFNNSIRFNSKGEYNVPFGKNRSSFNSNLRARLKLFIDKLEGITFENKSFDLTDIGKLTSEDFLYADPPYLIADAPYNENGGWGVCEENNLLNFLDKVNSKGVKFALSNVINHKGKANIILKKWSSQYNVHVLKSHYANCNYQTKDRSNNGTVEVLITNYDTNFSDNTN